MGKRRCKRQYRHVENRNPDHWCNNIYFILFTCSESLDLDPASRFPILRIQIPYGLPPFGTIHPLHPFIYIILLRVTNLLLRDTGPWFAQLPKRRVDVQEARGNMAPAKAHYTARLPSGCACPVPRLHHLVLPPLLLL